MTHTQPTVFVLMVGNGPAAAATDLDTAKATSLANETRYQTEEREYRWDQTTTWQTSNGRVWHLMVRSQRTKRWNKTLRSVAEVRTIPTAPTS